MSSTAENLAPPTRSVMENLLSPRGITALLGTGGALFVVGIIVWLATLGIFDHPLVLATCLGGVNLALLGTGFWLVLSTRHQLAGLALTLLACLLMPLHLWFYQAQELLTFNNHLWVAALVISLLYALTARVLQNVWFVPIFLGGIAMTMLLILADVGEFWQITAPAITLCLLGIVAIHAERLFTLDAASPFRRERFGLAFFWSGHALLGLGLLMVLIAQLAGGPLYANYTESIYHQWNVTRTDLVTTQSGKLTALFLVLAGIYAHLYSDLLVRRKGYYLQVAAMLMLWTVFIGIDLLGIEFELAYQMAICALLGAALIVVESLAGKNTVIDQPMQAIGRTGKAIFVVALLATSLLAVQTLVADVSLSAWPIFNALIIEALLAGLFYWTRRNNSAVNLYLACFVANIGLAGVLLVTMLQLPVWRKIELASVGLGLGMTILGFRAWVQEMLDHRRQPTVSPLLLLGALLIGIPMALVVMGYRSAGQFLVLDEAAMLIIGLVLLGAGCLCQLRVPAIAGVTLTMLYLAGLLLFVPWGHLGTASLILAGGGAGLFALGLGLSIFRDRLLELPTRLKERRGIFQVLGWR